MGLNYLQSPDINQQFFWPIMTLIICVQTYKKFGLVAKIGVGTFVCLIYIQNVKKKSMMSSKFSWHLSLSSSKLNEQYQIIGKLEILKIIISVWISLPGYLVPTTQVPRLHRWFTNTLLHTVMLTTE